MLRAQKRHISFHTPGHKRAGADITELSYSDNLFSPNGVIGAAEQDIARILGAERSFILTDGSTCGVHAMLYAAKLSGVKRVAYSVFSHGSVKRGCEFLGLETVEIAGSRKGGAPLQPTEAELENALACADALLLTSPDYYGNFPPLAFARELCSRQNKPLVIDGAHGSHLHFCPEHAGRYADLWTDGVHKSLPALTQGAVVSAKNLAWAERLAEGVAAFRTTSPSYPIMASVEYAVKFPRNEAIERAAREFKLTYGAYHNGDWTKILIPFGRFCDSAQAFLERKGVYPEFNDGNFLMFYLSPCTKPRELKKLGRLLAVLPRGECDDADGAFSDEERETELLLPQDAVGRICARECGLFPPCLPLVCKGERVTAEKAVRLAEATNTFGLTEGRLRVYTEEA